MIFPLNMGLSCKFSLKPIHWWWVSKIIAGDCLRMMPTSIQKSHNIYSYRGLTTAANGRTPVGGHFPKLDWPQKIQETARPWAFPVDFLWKFTAWKQRVFILRWHLISSSSRETKRVPCLMSNWPLLPLEGPRRRRIPREFSNGGDAGYVRRLLM